MRVLAINAVFHDPAAALVMDGPDRGPDGRGRARTWDWPYSVIERPPEELAREPVDVVILQRPMRSR